MESSEIKLIFSDIDGTLLNKEHVVTMRTKAAIKRAVSSGKVFIPVSARMPSAIQPIMSSIGIETPIISFNGALLQTVDGETIASYPMSSQESLPLLRFVESHYPSIAWNVYYYGDWFVANRRNEWIRREEEIVGLESVEISRSDLQQLDGIHKVLLMGNPEQIESVEGILRENFPSFSIAKSSSHLLEIMAGGIEKGKAVVEYTKHSQVPLSTTMAFGDNYNDWKMLEEVSYPYVMGNAPKELKDYFKSVTLDHNHDGIAVILEKLEDENGTI